MKRRGFIKSGMTTLAASVAAPAAFGEIIAPDSDYITVSEMDHFITKMDKAIDQISKSTGHYLIPQMNIQPSKSDLLNFQSSMRGLLLVGNFSDLSLKGQVHPGMQKRLLYSAPEINSSLSEMTNSIRSMSMEDKSDIQRALYEEPDLGDRIMESLDLEARAVGVPVRRRKQMKRMGNRIIKRLKHSPDMLINEYITKYDKLTDLDKSDYDHEHIIKKQIGEEAYYKRYTQVENKALEWQKKNLIDQPIGYKPLKGIRRYEDLPDENEQNYYRKGLRALGLGAIITAVGWIIIAISGGGVGLILGVTLGPFIILIALIMLLILAIKKPRE
jgi:hypothetical protein